MADQRHGTPSHDPLGRLESALAALADASPVSAQDDVVVLLDDEGRPTGTAERLSTHTDHTPVHLAFSSYLFDHQGRVLLTRRTLSKRAWPGVWTNSCCGHPKPGETFAQAVSRRMADELGTEVEHLTCVLPTFQYRAVDASGVVENELCPVFVGRHDGSAIRPNPDEVMDWQWVDWRDLVRTAATLPLLLSPWSALQIPQLHATLSEDWRIA